MNPALQLVNTIFETTWFGDDAPLQASFHPGDEDSKVIIVGGTNASGKSMVIKILSAVMGRDKVEPIQVSMRYRAGMEVPGFQRAMMFGSEDDESTGVISAQAIQGAIRTAQSRTAPHWVMFDEPDIGLAEEYAIPMGRLIGRFTGSPGEFTEGLAIVSHSKPLISGLLKEVALKPHFLHLDSEENLEQWLSTKSERTVDELYELGTKGITRWRQIQAYLKDKDAKKNAST